MRKRNEETHPASCWNKALPDDWVFVLLGRDAAAPATIRAWCDERIRLGKNLWDDDQIKEALRCALEMENAPHIDSGGH